MAEAEYLRVSGSLPSLYVTDTQVLVHMDMDLDFNLECSVRARRLDLASAACLLDSRR